MITQTEENYLKALWNITSNKGEASVNELSKQLDIKMPTVNSMMKRLAEKGLVIYESYKPLKLTEKGKKQAALIIRKHRLTEMYLVDKMGFGWEQVHDIAEQIEHIQSPDFFEKMDELLGYPKIDPHGSPIPDKNGKIEAEQYTRYIKLSDCKEGETVTFMAVSHSPDDLLKYLNSRDLALGSKIKIRSIEPFDDSMTVSYGGRKAEMLSKRVCEKLLVKQA
jgi:DtxR family transcriptional regulator, Mn-dependent transcriptional regulator